MRAHDRPANETNALACHNEHEATDAAERALHWILQTALGAADPLTCQLPTGGERTETEHHEVAGHRIYRA